MSVEVLVVGAVVGTTAIWAGHRVWRALHPPPPRPGEGPCAGCTSCPATGENDPLTDCKPTLDFE